MLFVSSRTEFKHEIIGIQIHTANELFFKKYYLHLKFIFITRIEVKKRAGQNHLFKDENKLCIYSDINICFLSKYL